MMSKDSFKAVWWVRMALKQSEEQGHFENCLAINKNGFNAVQQWGRMPLKWSTDEKGWFYSDLVLIDCFEAIIVGCLNGATQFKAIQQH